ncbi:DDE-type integrase/transposase/recombinase, partial [Methylobacterium trifolii]|uniref:DDE-type integrase/transposase/recombinase n=1 Tax=Methylobacterium trifolii TaxID=1003092 RepID=UPI001EDEE563
MRAFSRRIVGWAMANHLRSELVRDALEMAVTRRRPHDVIHYSDRGSRYTSLALSSRCQGAGVRPSIARSAMPTTTPRPRALILVL